MSAARRAARRAPPAVAGRRERRSATRRGAWIVGGAVRDALAGRAVVDLDLAVAGDEADGRAGDRARPPAGPRSSSRREFGTWRALAARPQLARRRDPAARRRRSRPTSPQRDFTVNAIAVPLADPAAEPTRPVRRRRRPRARRAAGGLRAQLRRRPAADPARGAARRPSSASSSTPRRCGWPARSAARAGEPAGERQLAELRLLVAGPDPLRGLELLDELGATAGVLPELDGAARRRAEPQPPPRRPRSHARGARQPARGRGATSSATRATRAGRRRARCSPSRSPTSSPAAARCASARSSTTSASPATRQEHEGGFVSFIGHDREGATDRPRGLRAAEDEPGALAPPRGAHPAPPAPRVHDPRAPALAAAPLRLPAADRAGRRRRHPAHRRRPALGPRQRPDRDARR